VTAHLHRDGLAVNHKRAMRIMREQGFTVRPRRRFVVTTNSNHYGPIFPNLAKELTLKGPHELWVADLTYIAIARGFVYLAVVLDEWSRRVVGYALGRAIDTKLTVAALRAAIEHRRPAAGVRIDPENNHTYLWPRIARLDKFGRFQMVWNPGVRIKPDPYCVVQSLDDWSADDLQTISH